MQDFRKLEIYKKAIEYCINIYKLSARLPVDEKYGIISQIRRAVSSISLNISEGAGTNTNNEFLQFISYSYRSVNEVLTCLELISRIGLYKNFEDIKSLEEEGVALSRMIYSFSSKLKT